MINGKIFKICDIWKFQAICLWYFWKIFLFLQDFFKYDNFCKISCKNKIFLQDFLQESGKNCIANCSNVTRLIIINNRNWLIWLYACAVVHVYYIDSNCVVLSSAHTNLALHWWQEWDLLWKSLFFRTGIQLWYRGDFWMVPEKASCALIRIGVVPCVLIK